MLQTTKAIVLKSVRYGESSLVVTLFTEQFGVQSYMVSGVRKSGKGSGKGGLLQPALLLDVVSDQRPMKNLLRLREFVPAHYYLHLQEDIIRNSVALFAVEFLQRLLPDRAPLPDAFQFSFWFLQCLDSCAENVVAYMPLFFATRMGSLCGYDLLETSTHHLSDHLHLNPQESTCLKQLLAQTQVELLPSLQITAATRKQLLHNYLSFLQNHSQHMGSLKSLPILEAILH